MQKRNLEALQSDAKAGKLTRLERLPFITFPDSPFVKGWAHIIAAAPKLGKTELLTALTTHWTDESVLWLTEESEEVWGERMAVRPLLDAKHIELAYAFGEELSEMQDEIYSTEASVIIIDTIRMLGIEDENNNAVVARELTPYIKMCRDRGQTLILVHHTRKTEGSHGTAISGGHAYAGIVDVLIEVSRLAHAPENRRRVTSLGRITSAPDILYEYSVEEQAIKVIGKVDDSSLHPSMARILEVLDNNFQTAEDIRNKLASPKLTKSTVWRSLKKMREDGLVVRDPEEDKERATYYWKKVKVDG